MFVPRPFGKFASTSAPSFWVFIFTAVLALSFLVFIETRVETQISLATWEEQSALPLWRAQRSFGLAIQGAARDVVQSAGGAPLPGSVGAGLGADLVKAAPRNAVGGAVASVDAKQVLVQFSEEGLVEQGVDGSVRFASAALEALRERFGLGGGERVSPQTATFSFSVQDPGRVEEAVAAFNALRGGGEVVFAEPDYPVTAAVVPNDEYFPLQWGLRRVNATAAWDVETGSPLVIVAVLDSGVDLDHPEFSSLLWRNLGEVAGNGVDDDANGFVDDVQGWNFVVNSSDVDDDFEHGTMVAGVVAAVTNNNKGIAGTCWSCKLMVVKTLDATGVGTVSSAARSIWYATENGADIIVASWTTQESSVLREAVDAAAAKGVVIVAAAGNDNTPTLQYPASYERVVKVAGTNSQDGRANEAGWGSSFGSDTDLAAPSTGIVSTYPGGIYVNASGTSLAAPFVAGAAALAKAHRPVLEGLALRRVLEGGVDRFGEALGVPDHFIGEGRLNLAKVLSFENATSAEAVISFPVAESVVNGSVVVRGRAGGEGFLLEEGPGDYPSAWSTINSGTRVSEGELGVWDTTRVPNGRYALRLSVWDNAGEAHEWVHVQVENTPCNVGSERECGGGVGVGACTPGVERCLAPGFWSACEGRVDPQSEVCGDGVDNDCDNETDEGCFLCDDADGDGTEGKSATCTSGRDCDDLNSSIHPGANEVCNNQTIDEDCSGAYCLPGDPNEDFKVDLFDLTLVGSTFGCNAAASQCWDAKAKRGDTNADGVVDVVDLSSISSFFGSRYGANESASNASSQT